MCSFVAALPSAHAQVRNAIDLARMGSAIRVFEEKMSPSSNGMVSEDELTTAVAMNGVSSAAARVSRCRRTS